MKNFERVFDVVYEWVARFGYNVKYAITWEPSIAGMIIGGLVYIIRAGSAHGIANFMVFQVILVGSLVGAYLTIVEMIALRAIDKRIRDFEKED